MSKEIKALKKQIEKLLDSGNEDLIKKEILNLYNKLFSEKLIKENTEIVKDLIEAGEQIDMYFEKEKKLINTYYNLAEKNAKNLEDFFELNRLYQYSNSKKAEKFLKKATPLCINFKDKWDLGMGYITFFLDTGKSEYSDIAKKICEEAINLLDDPKEKKEYKKNLDQKLSSF
jgi:hypothetical protein|tara:strand:- start:2123 stop:2641 length:519 start_codon:yes stop_codon:yes gene_type:complete